MIIRCRVQRVEDRLSMFFMTLLRLREVFMVMFLLLTNDSLLCGGFGCFDVSKGMYQLNLNNLRIYLSI